MENCFERFSLIISDISKQQHKLMASLMRKYGLNGSHAIYILSMHRHPDGISASRISECCSRDKSDVSRSMSVIVEKGFAEKVMSHQNRHRVVFKLTDKGKETAEDIQKRVNCMMELAEADLTEEKHAVLYEALDSVWHNLCNLNIEE